MNHNNKFEFLASSLKQSIVDGRFAPGERLPTFHQMEQNYNASRGVLQLAIEQLKTMGFVTSRERRGLFVSERPPHLQRYAIVFADKRSEAMIRFDKAFLNEARRLEESGSDVKCVIFDGACDKFKKGDVIEKLEYEISNHMVAGVILLPGTFDLLSRPSFSNKRLGKVFVFSPDYYTQAPRVATSSLDIINKTFSFFKKQNRKRVAVLHMANTMGDVGENDFKRYGFEYRPQWIQEIGRSHPRTVEKIILLLMDYPEGQRPDAIFIADDNLVEYSVSSILSLGLQVGKDLDIVGHCNWPWPVPSMVPIKRIGFHIGDILNNCIKIINQQNKGITPPRDTILPALFEEELQNRRQS